MHEHVNIHILRSLLWDYVHTAVCEKCLVRIEESVLLQVVLYRPTHLCVAHLNCTENKKQKKFTVFLWCGKVGGVFGEGGEGGGGGGGGVRWSMFQEVGVCVGFQRGVG